MLEPTEAGWLAGVPCRGFHVNLWRKIVIQGRQSLLVVLKLTVLPPTTGLYIQLCKTPVLQFLEFRTLIISLYLVRLDVSRDTDYLYHSHEHRRKFIANLLCNEKIYM